MPRMTIPEIINELKAELAFVKNWLEKEHEGMEEFLQGKKNTLTEIIKKLEDYEG